MALTETSGMTGSVATAYEKDYLYFADLATCWAKLLYPHMRKEVVGGKNLRGTTVQVPLYTNLAEVTSSLTEASDVTPVSMQDGYTSVTMTEEGNVLQNTRLLESIAAYTDIGKVAARTIAQNFAVRRDKILRNQIVLNATNIVYCGTAVTRVGLAVATDTITYAKIVEAVGRAVSAGIPPLPDGTYWTIYHPILDTELTTIASVYNIGYYQAPEVIMDGNFSKLNSGNRLPGETFKLGGLRFVRSPYGKVFLGAGAPTQGATHIEDTTSVAAGATTINVHAGAGANLTAGDWITIGTLESSATPGAATTVRPTTEQVQVTVRSTDALTIRGAGSEGKPGDTGLMFTHLENASVIEAPNVCALPVMGPESAVIAFASDVGWEGEYGTVPAPTQLPNRFINHFWYWVGGAKIIPKNVVQIECATAGKMYGNS